MVYRFHEIGDLYGENGWHREAIDAYLQGIFAVPLVDWDSRHRKEQMWLKVARLERLEGQPDLAAMAYLRAVYCDGRVAEDAKQGLAALFAPAPVTEAPRERPPLDAARACRIAELYAACNLQPLGLRLLAAPELADDPAVKAKREELAAKWAKIVGDCRQLQGEKRRLLGRLIDEVKSWAEVEVPRPSTTFWVAKRPEASGEQGQTSPANQ
jgi:hypothetical protein